MAHNALTDFATRQFAADDGYMAQDSADGGAVIRRRKVVAQGARVGIKRRVIIAGAEVRPRDLAAHAPEEASATTLDQALAARQTLARGRQPTD